MTSLRKFSLPAALIAGSLVLSSCGGGGSAAEGDDSTLRIGQLVEPTSWDPAQADQGNLPALFQSVYDPLVKINPDGSISPMLAEAWEWSDDGLSITLELRDDVSFTDGEEFNAQAVKANIEHFQEANGPMGNSLNSVESVVVNDDYTVTLELAERDPSLEYTLGQAGGFMGSPEALGSDEMATTPVGSGPYTLSETRTVSGSQIVVERNEDYWGEELPFDRVEFHLLFDETARLNALQSGQIDAAVFSRVSSAQELEAAGFHNEPFNVNWQGVLLFDRTGEMVPELGDVRVREALALGLDAEAILEAVGQGKGELTSQTFSPESTGFLEGLEQAYAYDPERAEDLLAEADADDLTVTLPISSTFDPAIYDSIQQNWEDIGVTVERHQWGPEEAIPSMQGGEHALAYMQLGARDSWSHINFLIAPEAPWNPLDTQTDELNELIQQVQDGDEEEQAEAAQQINQYVVDEVWFIPTYRPENLYYWSEDIEVEPQYMNGTPYIYNFSPADGT